MKWIHTSNPIITDKNEAEYNDPQGITYAVVGTAGADLHKFTGQTIRSQTVPSLASSMST
jgi:hypothetical protein